MEWTPCVDGSLSGEWASHGAEGTPTARIIKAGGRWHWTSGMEGLCLTVFSGDEGDPGSARMQAARHASLLAQLSGARWVDRLDGWAFILNRSTLAKIRDLSAAEGTFGYRFYEWSIIGIRARGACRGLGLARSSAIREVAIRRRDHCGLGAGRPCSADPRGSGRRDRPHSPAEGGRS